MSLIRLMGHQQRRIYVDHEEIVLIEAADWNSSRCESKITTRSGKVIYVNDTPEEISRAVVLHAQHDAAPPEKED
jgi:hypothetical protein